MKMRSNLQVQRPQTSMKEQDCHRVQGLGLLSFPIIIRRHRVSRTSNTLTTVHCLLSVLQSRNSYWPGGSSMRYFIFYSYVQLYINVNSLQRVTRIHNHNSHDKIVKLGLPQPWLRAICKKYEDWDPAVRLTIIILRGANNVPLPDSCPGAITKVWSSWSRVQKTSTKSHQQNIFVFSEIILIKRLI